MLVQFKNDVGITREIKVGFSWTSFFFGGFPFLFRGMPVHGIGWIFIAIITFGISNLVICFLINKQTAVHYLENGYKPVGPNWDVAASTWDISLPQHENVESTLSTESNAQQPPTSMPAPQTVTKVVTSPLPLIFMGGIAVLSSAFSLLVIYGFIAIDFATILVVLFSILNLGFFSWAANQYLDKNAHKVLAISLMVISFAINLERYRLGMI